MLAAFVPPLHAAELKRWKGKPAAPPIDLLLIDGTPLSLQQLRGKVVLVNFWATWCEPCITEMPSLQRLREQLARRRLRSTCRQLPGRAGAHQRLHREIESDAAGRARHRRQRRARAGAHACFPANYLVDRAGNIRHSISGGADWTSPPLVSTIRTLLAAQPSR